MPEIRARIQDRSQQLRQMSAPKQPQQIVEEGGVA